MPVRSQKTDDRKVDLVMKERLKIRREKLLYVLSALESNKKPGDLPHLPLEKSDKDSLPWRKVVIKKASITPEVFVAKVDMTTLLSVAHASVHLDMLLGTLSAQHLDAILRNPTVEGIGALLQASNSNSWSELVHAFLMGTFNPHRTERDLDQSMPIRSRFRTTGLFRQLLNRKKSQLGHCVLTSRDGLGAILAYFLPGQSFTTIDFTEHLGIATSSQQIVDSLNGWADNELPFENMSLYGQANARFTFVYGAKTNLLDPKHMARISARFAYYFCGLFQHEWLKLIGKLKGVDVLEKAPEEGSRVSFEDALQFWYHLFVVFQVKGLGSGLLPLQITNTLVEVGLVAPASLKTIADFVAQTKLGASKGLASLGFPVDSPSLLALSFRVSYLWVRECLKTSGVHLDGIGAFRYDPADHEHMLCKLVRVKKLMREARISESKLHTWARTWIPDLQANMDPELVRKENEGA